MEPKPNQNAAGRAGSIPRGSSNVRWTIPTRFFPTSKGLSRETFGSAIDQPPLIGPPVS